VVDLWAGTVGERGLVHTWSTVKPVTATCLLLAVRAASLPLRTPVRELWPELGAAADGHLTVGGLLSHRAGLVTVPRGGRVPALTDVPGTVAALEGAEPDWPPGGGAGEHALTYGALVGELVRRVDGRSLGAFLRDELAPLGVDVHIGLADDVLERAVDLEGATPQWWESLAEGRPQMRPALGTGVDEALVNGEAWRRAEVAAVNGHATARGLATFWRLALDGTLPPDILQAPAAGREPDLVLGSEVAWTAGSAQAEGDDIGMGGVGGSYGGVRRDAGLAWAFLTTRMGDHERATELELALLASL